MPSSTLTPGVRMYMSGTPLIGRSPYAFPDCYQDPYWVAQWKFLDISSGSGLDSKCASHLIASGSPTQVAGYRQASGVQFDGINDCFYNTWAALSGFGDFEYPQLRGATVGNLNPCWGFMCSLKVDDFSKDQFIISKWNTVGSDREWAVGINTSGGIFYMWKSEAVTTIRVTNSASGNLVPSGQWFDFCWQYGGPHAANGGPFYYWINDAVFADAFTSLTIEDTGASGVIVVGAANFGLQPSGFFTGSMEDFRFYNGRRPSMPNFNAFRSGIAPMSTWPSLNGTNPYIGAHFTLDSWQSGATTFNGLAGSSNVYMIDHSEHANRMVASGSNLATINRLYGSAALTLSPGAADGTKGSGVRFSSAYWSRPAPSIQPGSSDRHMCHTIMAWVRPEVGTLTNTTMNVYGYGPAGSPVANTYAFTDRDIINCELQQDGSTFQTAWVRGPSTVVNSGVWAHVVWVVDLDQGTIDTYISGVAVPSTKLLTVSGLWLKSIIPTNYSIHNMLGFALTNLGVSSSSYSGLIDEVIQFNYAVPSGQITSFYQQQSGILPTMLPASGSIGGYTTGSSSAVFVASGMFGSYILAGIQSSGNIGGWISGLPINASGMIGSYINSLPSFSGSVAGYIWGIIPTQNTIGAYAFGIGLGSGLIGGYTRGVETVDQSNAFVAFFNIIGRNKAEFDAQAKIALSQIKEYDAKAVVYIEEKPPLVNIFIPSVDQSGNFAPYTYNFEATASGQQGKTIYRTFWFFTDVTATSGSTITSSGTYATSHTFSKSGIFNVVFIAIDSNGLIASDRRIINTASGYALPTISLSATPESGVAPLSVAFSGIVNSAPAEIVEKYIYFGDGTRSACTDGIYKLYPVIGEYIPVFRVRDKNGFIVTDSTVIGVNN